MSALAKRWASRQRIASGPIKSVLQTLAYLHREGGELFPSQEHIATEAGLSIRAVREALDLMEHFALIRRTPRSRGWYGRSSDRFELALDREFTLSKNAISVARKAMRTEFSNRHRVPLANGDDRKMQPAPGADATGTGCRGIEGYKKQRASQGKNTSEVEVRDTREARPRLAVVVGGRS